MSHSGTNSLTSHETGKKHKEREISIITGKQLTLHTMCTASKTGTSGSVEYHSRLSCSIKPCGNVGDQISPSFSSRPSSCSDPGHKT